VIALPGPAFDVSSATFEGSPVRKLAVCGEKDDTVPSISPRELSQSPVSDNFNDYIGRLMILSRIAHIARNLHASVIRASQVCFHS
jgi:hypothetical protein